jgi:hypothetical protein
MGGGWAPPAPMPGGVPLRPLTVSDILSGAFTLIRRNPVSTLGLAALVEGLAGIATAFLSLGEQSLIRRFTNTFTRDENLGLPSQTGHDVGHFFVGLVPYLLASVVIAVVVQSVLTGMLTGVFGRGLIGDRIGIGRAWQISRAFWVFVVSLLTTLIIAAPPVLLALIVIGLAVAKVSAAATIIGVIGGIALIPLTLWIGVSLSMSIPVVVLEGVSPITAVQRSWRLVRGSWWRVFGINLLTLVIVFIIAGIFEVPFGIAQLLVAGHGSASIFAGLGSTARVAGPSVLAIVISTIGSIIATTCTRPVGSGVTVLLYADLRMRKEGLDLMLQQAGQTQSLSADQFTTLWQQNNPGAGTLPPQPPPQSGGISPGPGQTGW